MRYDELPAKLKRQVDAAAGTQKRKRDRKGASTVRIHGWCHTCGVEFDHERRWEAHVAETGHARLDLIGGRAS